MKRKDSKVGSLYSDQVETDFCAACQAFTLYVRAWEKLKRLCALVDNKILIVSPF